MADSRCLSGGAICYHRMSSLRTGSCDFAGIRRRLSKNPTPFNRWKADVMSSSAALRWSRRLRFELADVPGALCPTWKHGGFGFRGVWREGGAGYAIRAVIDVAGLSKRVQNLTDVKVLSEWGILFLLFEMGLELSLARLQALAKYAFVMGLTQVVLSTLAFTLFELPPNGAIGTKILEFLFHSRPDLVNIRSIDEAIVIGASLSLSSSAFVLQLLAEKGELPTRLGSATLGILLLQDIAVVPLLVILPILESQNLGNESIWPMLATESLKALGGLGLLSLGGKYLLRRVFEVVAESRSSEAFVALCLLTVSGTSLLTQALGFSDTLGAFLAGALLAETNFRTQIEADIRPFRGLLLGLFFVTTGTSIDMQAFGTGIS